MKDATQFHIRPARPEEAGLFYTPHPEEDKRLGTVGHVRMDFGRSGNEFWHTWWPRGPEELNSPAFKLELQEVMDTLRESVLKNRFAKSISSPGHLSARDFSFGEGITQAEHGKLNFYVKTEFDVDAVFGTNVLTDENDDWLNIYANYDVRNDELCDSLELTLCKADGSNENWSYPLNAAEKEALLCKIEEYCQQQTGMSLHGYAQYWHAEEGIQPMMRM